MTCRQTCWESVRQIGKRKDRDMILSCSVSMSWCSPSCAVMKDRLAAHKSPERLGAWGAITEERAVSALFLHSTLLSSTAAPQRMARTRNRTDNTIDNKHMRACLRVSLWWWHFFLMCDLLDFFSFFCKTEEVGLSVIIVFLTNWTEPLWFWGL